MGEYERMIVDLLMIACSPHLAIFAVAIAVLVITAIVALDIAVLVPLSFVPSMARRAVFREPISIPFAAGTVQRARAPSLVGHLRRA